jgi:hypothetical protein
MIRPRKALELWSCLRPQQGSQKAEERLGDDEQLAQVHPVGHHTAPRPEQERGGTPTAARTSPRSLGERVSSRTSQPMAVCCKKVPLAETTDPRSRAETAGTEVHERNCGRWPPYAPRGANVTHKPLAAIDDTTDIQSYPGRAVPATLTRGQMRIGAAPSRAHSCGHSLSVSWQIRFSLARQLRRPDASGAELTAED